MAKKPKHKTEYCNKFKKDFKNGPHQKKKKPQNQTNKQTPLKSYNGWEHLIGQEKLLGPARIKCYLTGKVLYKGFLKLFYYVLGTIPNVLHFVN